MDDAPPLQISMTENMIAVNPKNMETEVLSKYVEDSMAGVCIKLRDLKPYVEELWTRFDTLPKGGSIRGCKNKKQFCEWILNREPQTVRRMLSENASPEPATERQLKTSCDSEPDSEINQLREWIKVLGVYAQIQPTAYGIIARSSGVGDGGGYDLQLRSITEEQVKTVCEALKNYGT